MEEIITSIKGQTFESDAKEDDRTRPCDSPTLLFCAQHSLLLIQII